MAGNVIAHPSDALLRGIDRVLIAISRHWLALFLVFYGIFVGLPWAAPELMYIGQRSAGQLIHNVYAVTCHQYPERSFFLYGPKVMYSAEEIATAWPHYTDIARWRQFVGTPEMGWKLAWSDRMVSMYSSIWLGALIYALVRRRLRSLPGRWFLYLTLPILLDGGTHMISDLLGLTFRQNNAWLAVLTGHEFPATFYAGDALSSFNSWMRLASGFIFGLAVVWFAFPFVDRAFHEVGRDLVRPPERL